MSVALVKALAVTCELTGTTMTEAAAEVMVEDLKLYPEQQVLKALHRCRRELRGHLTLHDILTRLEDGRPGPEEAWAMLPRGEEASVVWTTEMQQAYGVALPLLQEGDVVAARMAFLERYRALVQAARDSGAAPVWQPSLGTDQFGRAAALETAVRLGRIEQNHAHALLANIHHGDDDNAVRTLGRLRLGVSEPGQEAG